jgi:hypothetical protein
MNEIKIKKIISETVNSVLKENYLYGYVQAAIKNVKSSMKKGSGNAENLKSYGLLDLADHLDSYSKGSEIIYSSKTISLFKQLVDSMVSDEISNNHSK